MLAHGRQQRVARVDSGTLDCPELLLPLKPGPALYLAAIAYEPACTPASDKEALALPPETVPDVTEMPLTVKVTVPLFTAGPLAGVTVAVSVADASP